MTLLLKTSYNKACNAGGNMLEAEERGEDILKSLGHTNITHLGSYCSTMVHFLCTGCNTEFMYVEGRSSRNIYYYDPAVIWENAENITCSDLVIKDIIE